MHNDVEQGCEKKKEELSDGHHNASYNDEPASDDGASGMALPGKPGALGMTIPGLKGGLTIPGLKGGLMAGMSPWTEAVLGGSTSSSILSGIPFRSANSAIFLLAFTPTENMFEPYTLDS